MERLRGACKFLLFCLAFIGLFDTVEARDFKNRQYALISYTFSIHPDVRQKISPFDGLFPQNPEEYSRVDPVYFRLKGLCFDRLKMRFERELSLFILPIRIYGKQYFFCIFNIFICDYYLHTNCTASIKYRIDVSSLRESSEQEKLLRADASRYAIFRFSKE